MPVLFLKPPSVLKIVSDAGAPLPVRFLQGCGSLHHECEIVCLISIAGGKPTITHVTLGLDLTLRDKQADLKKKGHPWEVSKVFADSAIIGPWIPVAKFENYLETEFSFSLDGKVKQAGKGLQMSVDPVRCLAYASEYFPICEGDLLFTGTPAGVGPIQPGQVGRLTWGNKLDYSVRWKS